ncbi:MAG: DUF3427 domain-containing protein [Anaerobutyricum soehngenii]
MCRISLKQQERGIDVQLFVRKNKDDKISKEFYYLGRYDSDSGQTREFINGRIQTKQQ